MSLDDYEYLPSHEIDLNQPASIIMHSQAGKIFYENFMALSPNYSPSSEIEEDGYINRISIMSTRLEDLFRREVPLELILNEIVLDIYELRHSFGIEFGQSTLVMQDLLEQILFSDPSLNEKLIKLVGNINYEEFSKHHIVDMRLMELNLSALLNKLNIDIDFSSIFISEIVNSTGIKAIKYLNLAWVGEVQYLFCMEVIGSFMQGVIDYVLEFSISEDDRKDLLRHLEDNLEDIVISFAGQNSSSIQRQVRSNMNLETSLSMLIPLLKRFTYDEDYYKALKFRTVSDIQRKIDKGLDSTN